MTPTPQPQDARSLSVQEIAAEAIAILRTRFGDDANDVVALLWLLESSREEDERRVMAAACSIAANTDKGPPEPHLLLARTMLRAAGAIK